MVWLGLYTWTRTHRHFEFHKYNKFSVYVGFSQQFQQHSIDVILAMTTASVTVTNLLIYCFFGKLATESFAKMSDCVYNMDWHELPIGLQKYLILMIANMQKPLYFHGFGVINLNLETFTKVRITHFQHHDLYSN